MAIKITHADIGDRLTPQATFTVAGTPTDPTQIVVKQQDPAGVESTITTAASPATLTPSSTPLARVSAGVFKLNPGVSATSAGHWFFRFEATGTAESAKDFQYDVDPSEFYLDGGLSARALVGLADAKDWLQVQNIDTSNDLELARVINDVSDRIHYEADREFKPITAGSAVRLFDVTYTSKRDPWYVDGVWMGDLNPANRTVFIGDLSSAPTLVRILDRDWTTVLETVSAGNYTVLPLVRQSWEPIRWLQFKDTVTSLSPGMRVEVTGTWGFPAVPGNIRQAALDSIVAIMDRSVESYAQDLGVQPGGEQGNVIVVGGGRQKILNLPGSAWATCQEYRDVWIG
jgi:hypothetical protein